MIMNKPGTQPSTLKVVALVRDKNGKPKFDNINNIPDYFWDQLSDTEKEDIRNERNSSHKC